MADEINTTELRMLYELEGWSTDHTHRVLSAAVSKAFPALLDEIDLLRAALAGVAAGPQATPPSPGVVHPSFVCWSCHSHNVTTTDHDGHGAAIHVNPENNGRFTTTCNDCGATWTGQLRRTVSPRVVAAPTGPPPQTSVDYQRTEQPDGDASGRLSSPTAPTGDQEQT